MTKLSTDSYKGVRDFYPEDSFHLRYIFGVWRKVAESFGYVEYKASILEPSEIYKQKSGDEIVNEQTFTFTDRGGREVTLRPEMTPTVARMVAARRRELGFPLRWYSIPNLFRYETPQRGRLREHWQLNIDVFGIKTIEADIENIVIAYEIMKAFGAKDEDFEIRLNTHSTKEALDQVLIGLKASGITNTRIDETLKRGQAYYTGVVFEIFDTDKVNPRSISGGGRYDNLIDLFSSDAVPAVGFASGDVTMRDFLETKGLLPVYRSTTDLFLVLKDGSNVETIINFYKLADRIRSTGINVATDGSNRSAGDLYKSAERNFIPYISFVDADSMSEDKLVVKNMKTREEQTIEKVSSDESHERICSILKK